METGLHLEYVSKIIAIRCCKWGDIITIYENKIKRRILVDDESDITLREDQLCF